METNYRKAIAGARQAGEAHQKALNVWTSLNNAGVTFGGQFATNVNDFQLLASSINNWCVFKVSNMNATQVASTPYHLLKTTTKGTVTKSLLKTVKGRRLKPKEIKRLKKSVTDDVEVVEVTDHPILDVLQKYNEDLNGFNLLKLIQLGLEVFGRNYLLKLDASGNPTTAAPATLKFLKPYYVYPERDPEGNVVRYSYSNVTTNGKTEPVPLEKDAVIAFRNVALSDPYGGGTSWLRSVWDQVELSDKFTEYSNWLLDNRARPDYLISPKSENASKDELKRLEQDFINRVGGKNNGKPLTTTEAVTVTPLQFPPTDLAPLEFAEGMIKAVCNAADVPVALLDKDSTYANFQGALTHWKDMAIAPRVCLIEQVLNDSLVPSFGDESLWLEFENPVPEDIEQEQAEDTLNIQRAQVLATTASGTVDELRAFLGLAPLDDGGDDMISAPAAAPADPEADAPDAESESSEEPDDQPADDGKAFDLDSILKINTQVTEHKLPRSVAITLAARALGVDEAEAKGLIGFPAERKGCGCGSCQKAKGKTKLPEIQQPSGAGLKAVLRGFYEKMKSHFMGQVKKSVTDTVTKMFDADQKAVNLFGLPDKFVPLDEWSDELGHKVQPLIRIDAKQAADGRVKALTRIGADPDVFSVVPANIDRAVKKASLNLAQSTISTTTQNLNDALKSLRQELTEGLLDGDPVDLLRERVGEIFAGLDDDHAELIARTEASRAVHTGQQIAAKASGIVKGFKFLISDESCDECQMVAEDTPEIPIDGSFSDGSYDDSPLPVHPNCRCTMMEVIDEEALNAGVEEDEGE